MFKQIKSILLPTQSSQGSKRLLNSIGKEAKVELTIVGPYQAGRVYYKGSWWPARCVKDATLVPGEVCYVVGMNNITLLVEPEPDPTEASVYFN
ncbi:MAG: NfeD family protein [Oscillatoria sp. PMC 1051.18]|nr:NfeD family protein [Oscillatoria sp. PMC 1050.18]MEC5029490.1 NfeD family protein [Oscillatoria sp. PMC 1051.18]